MSKRKLNQLFQAARTVAAPSAAPDLADRVLRAIRQTTPAPPPSIFDELNSWFPRLAPVMCGVLAMGVVASLAMDPTDPAGLDDSAAQISSQWFLDPEGL